MTDTEGHCEWGCHEEIAEVEAERDAAREALARVEAVLADEWRDEPPTALYPEGRRLYRWPADLRADIRAALAPATPDTEEKP